MKSLLKYLSFGVDFKLQVPPLMYKNNTHNICGVRNQVNNPDLKGCNGRLCMYVCNQPAKISSVLDSFTIGLNNYETNSFNKISQRDFHIIIWILRFSFAKKKKKIHKISFENCFCFHLRDAVTTRKYC